MTLISNREYLVAHSPPDDHPNEWHDLDTHLGFVAGRSAQFARKAGLADVAFVLGLFHDLGKATEAFQTYIRQSWQARTAGRTGPRSGSTPHAIHGALLLSRWLLGESKGLDVGSGLELAQVVLHHHGGLRNASDSLARLEAAFQDVDLRNDAAQAVGRVPRVRDLLKARPPRLDLADPLDVDMATRFLLSVLVDADRLDTESFANRQKANLRKQQTPSIHELRNKIRESQAALTATATETPVNQVRQQLYNAVMLKASEATGSFRLTVPTGGGKTRTAIAFALEHAAIHNLERVIVAIPFTSIIEQTADVYREIFGFNAILEHHSNVRDDECDVSEDRWARRLPTENWDAPIVVTTTVQLFESLFSNHTSKLRKVHRLARSVIVLDEAQSLPAHLLETVVSGLGTLTNQRFGSSVVLCTATQPALDVVSSTDAFCETRELAPNPGAVYRELARVKYDVRLEKQAPWEDIADECREHNQVLVIVNTTFDAQTFAKALGPGCLHLSTRMCPDHRRAVLREVRRRLANQEACQLVSTQLIEAGVDVDFPVVYRALAPLDAIAQAAGRCNREGKRDVGQVVVFEPEDAKLPPGYRTATQEARVLLRDGADLHDPVTFQRYFEALYGKLTDLDPHGIQNMRRDLKFESVSEAFKVIQDDTMPVVIPTVDPVRVEPILEAFAAQQADLSDLRALQPFSVQVRRRDFETYRREGWVLPVGNETTGLWVWHGHYDDRFGLEPKSSDQAYVL